MVRWSRAYPTAVLATFENFLRGTALLPQLALIHRAGRVSPALVHFLVVVALWNLAEVCTDLNAYWHMTAAEARGEHFVNFLLGDAVTSLVLLDYLYMYCATRSAKRSLLPG